MVLGSLQGTRMLEWAGLGIAQGTAYTRPQAQARRGRLHRQYALCLPAFLTTLAAAMTFMRAYFREPPPPPHAHTSLPAHHLFLPACSSLADASAGSIFVSRVGGSVEWSRPLGIGWQGGLGASWQRATPRDERARPLDQDCYGGQLTISGTGQDTMALGILRLAYA